MSDTGGDDARPVRYQEPARGYRSLLYTLGALALGFVLDLALTGHGAVIHLPGWLVLGALLLALHALFVYAVRATHSLTLTDETLRIGDESVPLASIASVSADQGKMRRTDDGRRVLGWPDARPRGVHSLVLRLQGDMEIDVPTRAPARLRAALGIADSPIGDPIVARVATGDDLPLLADIDERAEAIFRVAGYDLPRIAFDAEGADGAAAVFVVDDPPVGFAVVHVVDGVAHLAELAVLPGSMRRGRGTVLVGRVIEWAREHGHDAVTLITYADVPWNGPFYLHLGFVELPASELSPGLRARREQQTELGLDTVGRRIVMRRAV